MQTLGDVVTAGLILAALIVVPYKIAKAWLWPYVKPMIMSRLPSVLSKKADIEAVSIPVLDTGMDDESFSRDITVNEWIVRMSCARNEEKKYRFSANQIYAAVGGDRNTVLATIREIRSGPPAPEFRQPDGTTAPATRPVTGRRTHA